MRFATCNEPWGKMPLEEVFEIAARIGFAGVEVAPFTIADHVEEISTARRKEIVKAAEQGADERIKELKGQLPDTRGESNKLTADFLEQVEQFLEPEQKETLERFRQEMTRGSSRIDLRGCFRFVSRLDLDQEQRQTLRQIQSESRQAERQARRDPAARGQLLEQVQQQLRDMLTAEQTAEFDRWLEDRKSPGGSREKRGGRPRGERRGKRTTDDDTP